MFKHFSIKGKMPSRCALGRTLLKAADFLVLEKECIFLPLELGSLLSVQDSVDTFVIMQIDEGGGLYILIW